MDYIKRELGKLRDALNARPKPNEYDRLYAAQQALSWAEDPTAYKSPTALIIGTREGSEDCPALSNPQSS